MAEELADMVYFLYTPYA